MLQKSKRIEMQLPVHRTAKIEKELVGQHLHDLIPRDLFKKHLKPKDPEPAEDKQTSVPDTQVADAPLQPDGESSNDESQTVAPTQEIQTQPVAVPVDIAANMDVIRELVQQNARLVAVAENPDTTDKQAAVASGISDMNQKLLAALLGMGKTSSVQAVPVNSPASVNQAPGQQESKTAPFISIDGENIHVDPKTNGTITMIKFGEQSRDLS